MTKSVGSVLRDQREKKKLTLQDVYKSIKIHPKYLRALEDDDYSVFDGKVHAKGFLKTYTEFLGLNLSEILAFWRREHESMFEKAPEEHFARFEHLEAPKFVWTSGFILTVSIVSIVILFFGYLFFQYRSYTGNPNLEIFYPEENRLLEVDIVDVTGRTELDSEVFINNQKVILNPTGNFATSIKLKEGINTLSILAVNKLGKKTENIRTIIYRPQKVEVKEVLETTESTQVTPTSPFLP